MFGHGGPHIGPRRLRRRPNVPRRLGRLLPIALGLCALAAAAATAAGEELDVRLRIAWGGGESRSWQGTIAVSAGTISEPSPLSLEADAPGSMLPLDEATIRILPRTPRSYDGCDLRVRAPADARLIVKLWADNGPPTEPLEVPLSRVVANQGFAQMGLDNRQNRLLAQRTPGDALRVRFDRPSLVFAPSERFEFEFAPHALGLTAGTNYLLAVSLGPARTEDNLWTEDREVRVDASGRIAPLRLTVPLPPDEGVYDVRLAVYPKRLTTSLTRGKPLASRKVQLVVVSPVKTIDRTTPTWHSVVEFDPSTPRWWERMTRIPTLRRLPNMPQHPVGSSTTSVRTHQGRSWLELPPQAWQGYPLSVAEPGQPHVLEIEYPSDIEQTLAISLVEPNAAGQVGPIGVDSGIDVPPPGAGHRADVRRHRLVFWPQTRSPMVVLVNRREDVPAVLGKVQVLAGPAELPPLSIARPNFPSRTLAAYYEKPLMAENFSATEAVDPISGRSLDDWVTFHQAGRRMVEALEQGGYNAVVLTVVCEGSALYPSELLQPTPRYDTGAFFDSGQDAVRKDVLDMLFQLCNRSGIQLIPAVQFTTPLPKLEQLRQAGGSGAVGLEPVGPDGRTWLERHGPQRGVGHYYNPLDERVQQAMLEVVAELAQRYGHHASFGGVAVHLGSDSYTLLPDEANSLDERTFGRFLEATGTLPDSGRLPLASRVQHVYGPGQSAWLAWRSRELTGLFRRMREEVVRYRPGARLVLATSDLLGGRATQQALRPSLSNPEDPRAVFAALGLDVAQLAQEGIVVPRPQRLVSPLAAESRELQRHWSALPELTALFAPQGRAAAMHFAEPAPLRLPEFDAVSPFGPENTRTLFVSQIVPADAAQREHFVRSIASLDAPLIIDGGWLLPLGQEAALAPLAKVYRRLPVEPFTSPSPTSPPAQTRGVVVRTLAKADKTYFYAVNETPWPVKVEIEFDAPETFRLLPYADERRAEFRQTGGGGTWSVAMEPFDLVGGELTSGRANVRDWRITFPPDAAGQLGQQIADVGLRTNHLRIWPRPLDVLVNPSFEMPAGGGIPGWGQAWGPGITVEVDATQASHLNSSLHLASRPERNVAAPNVSVRSDPFPTPSTGRLMLKAMLRVADPARQPQLRMAVEGRLNGQLYYHGGNLGLNDARQPVAQLSTQWMPFVHKLPNLPREGLTDLRIGFDLMGEGEVWIDEVQVYDLWLDDQRGGEYHTLLKNNAVANHQLLAGELADCHAFADSYWPSFLRRHVKLDPPPAAPAADGPPLPRPPAANPADPPPSRSAKARSSEPRSAEANEPAEKASRWRSWIPSWPKWR